MLAQNVAAPKPAMPPASQPQALPANTAGGPSFAQFLTDQAAPASPPVNAAPEAGQAEAEEAPQPAPAQSATRRAAAQPAKPAAPRAADATPKADAKAAPAEDKSATDAVAADASAGEDEDDAPETSELKEFTQLLGMATAQSDAAAAALKPDAHQRRAATADDDAPQGRAALRATDKARVGETPEPAAAKPGDLRADKAAAARAAAAEPLQVGTQQAGSDPPATAPTTQPATPSFAAALAQALPTPANLAADATPAASYAGVQAPLHSMAFAPELGARVSLLAVDGVQQAELQLNPADMGPVSVQIVVDGGQAQVSFHAAQAETRQALEQSLPDLAAALQGQGLTLSGGGVFQQAPRDADHGEDRSDAGHSSGASRGGNDRIGGMANTASAPARRTVGLLDTFA